MDNEITFESLRELGFHIDEDLERVSFQIGNNTSLVYNNDDEWSIRPSWGSTDGYDIWGKPTTIQQVRILVKLLSNENI